MNRYHLLWQCWCSGQMSHEQWNEHLKDDLLRAWLYRRKQM